jgi:hypothetical protein
MRTCVQLLGVSWIHCHTVPRIEAEFLTTQGLTTRQPSGREGGTQVLVGRGVVVVVVEDVEIAAGPPHPTPRAHSGTNVSVV